MRVLIEGTKFTRADAARLFNKSSRVYDELVSSGYVQASDYDSGVVNFVGVGVFEEYTIKFLPKIFRDLPSLSDGQLKLLIRTLKKYAKNIPEGHPDAGSLSPYDESGRVSQLAQADWLINDYMHRGLYKAKPSKQIKAGAPVIDWQRTISRSALYISNGNPVYLEPEGRTNKADNSHVVSRLHRYAVETSMSRYANLLGFNSISIDHEVVSPIGKLPESSVIEKTLRQELYLNYSDREVRLLKILIAWFKQEQSSSKRRFKPYGVREFWPVWESICKFIFHDQVSKWTKKIPAPLWTKRDGESKNSSGKWLPDVIMSSHGEDGQKHLFIMDAKYYNLSLPASLSGEPGVGDITKQLFYGQALHNRVQEEDYRGMINCLVFPSVNDDLMTVSGFVNIEGIFGGPICVIYMDLCKAFERYLSCIPLSSEEQMNLKDEYHAALSTLTQTNLASAI